MTYMVIGELTSYGEQPEEFPIEAIGVTNDPDLAEFMAECEVARYAQQSSSAWKRTSKNRWKAWEPGDFRYIVAIQDRDLVDG